MSDERCACGRFTALPGGLAQIADGVFHVPAVPTCEVESLHSRLAAAEREVDRLTGCADDYWKAQKEAESRASRLEAALRDAIEGHEGTVPDFWESPLGKRLAPIADELWPRAALAEGNDRE